MLAQNIYVINAKRRWYSCLNHFSIKCWNWQCLCPALGISLGICTASDVIHLWWICIRCDITYNTRHKQIKSSSLRGLFSIANEWVCMFQCDVTSTVTAPFDCCRYDHGTHTHIYKSKKMNIVITIKVPLWILYMPYARRTYGLYVAGAEGTHVVANLSQNTCRICSEYMPLDIMLKSKVKFQIPHTHTDARAQGKHSTAASTSDSLWWFFSTSPTLSPLCVALCTTTKKDVATGDDGILHYIAWHVLHAKNMILFGKSLPDHMQILLLRTQNRRSESVAQSAHGKRLAHTMRTHSLWPEWEKADHIEIDAIFVKKTSNKKKKERRIWYAYIVANGWMNRHSVLEH